MRSSRGSADHRDSGRGPRCLEAGGDTPTGRVAGELDAYHLLPLRIDHRDPQHPEAGPGLEIADQELLRPRRPGIGQLRALRRRANERLAGGQKGRDALRSGLRRHDVGAQHLLDHRLPVDLHQPVRHQGERKQPDRGQGHGHTAQQADAQARDLQELKRGKR